MTAQGREEVMEHGDLVGRLRDLAWGDASPEAKAMRAAADALEALQAENFMLAAGACINPGKHALVGDERGNSVCTAYEALQAEERAHSEALARIAALDAELAGAREALGEVFADHDAVNRLSWIDRAAGALEGHHHD